MFTAAQGLFQRPTERTVSVVIPTMNEARNIPVVLSALPSYVDEVVLVDAASVDGTVEAALAVRPDLRVVRQTRKGKGNALAAGFEAATGDYIVMIDADGSMDPAEITRFVTELDAGADYVKGSRFMRNGGSDDISRLRRAGNWGLNALTNLLFRTTYTDLCYGYNAFRADAVRAFALAPAHEAGARWGDGFEVETLINIRVARAALTIREVPSFESDRLHGESNLRTFRDGWRVLATILRERFSPERTPAHTPQVSRYPVDSPGMTSPALGGEPAVHGSRLLDGAA
jgi:glycosyltransferase involved in cell wall biosynthesis